MEKALRILDDAIKALESEVRIWTKQGDLDIAEKCKNEIKQCTGAIEKLRGGECSNENSGLNIPVVSNLLPCPFCGKRAETVKSGDTYTTMCMNQDCSVMVQSEGEDKETSESIWNARAR